MALCCPEAFSVGKGPFQDLVLVLQHPLMTGCSFCRAAATLAGLPGTDAQHKADAASTRGTLHQMDKALKQARQHSEECCRQAEMQKLALGSLIMLAQPGEH